MIKRKTVKQDLYEIQNMTKEKFARVMRKKVGDVLGSGYKVVIQSVRKNNAVVLTGLSIFREDCNISPTIYMEEFYERLQEGEKPDDLAKQIAECYRKHCPSACFDVKRFTDYAYVRTQLAYKLISREKNESLLEEIPHVPYLNLEIVFFCKMESEQFGCGLILIKNEHLRMWEKETAELLRDAEKNMKTLYPEVICTIEELFLGMGQDQLWCGAAVEDKEAGARMYVLTNKSKTYGAAVILYPGVLDALSRRLESDLALMPSSVHEMIAIPVADAAQAADLVHIVHDVNTTQVAEEEILADNVYYFDRKSGEIRVIGEAAAV